ncbi:Hpt domain-containing protein [Vibrio sp. 10N.261.46.E12]|uniref:Hpt domain-containing protein n=1 Tax=unclassified Vibrio TaxID=2614977 RepID=UPI000978898B|nr:MULTISPECIES: Hpt domain-containing protein [unclassified Vibrio]OMO37333.1 phosphorelay protein LuxU [Vibrio sp. 10N.261.45.E1]PMJ21964.1 phosphorelay protein LuxU [Vibrio sp. 10N.286.45.B6]PML90604.1 phosphorelay protein LuxU [Vibrio sp. 10N.261.49.E11]PMM72083.1 phosphorelay protein LuxU [Vibrio sp. 10N.261.46.F12]PMM80642.1 phosphorelay protein LuxU [Vibrio sp. 10N.261.46.E8]
MNSTLASDTPADLSLQEASMLVDESVLEQMIRDTSADIIPILIDHYVEESQTRLVAIKEAATQKDAQTLEFEVHTLGSTALSLGNRPLGELSRALEKQCLEQSHDAAFQQVDELLELAERSIKALLERKEAGFS